VVVTPDASDSDQSNEAEVNPNQSAGTDESAPQSAPQAAAYPDANSGSFADLNQFVPSDDVFQSPIGALLQRNCSQLTKGPWACGLAVLEIRPGSPAALAGLRPYSGLVHTLLGASIVGAGMAFPPAIAALGLVEQSHVGEKFDLIIAVDGERIRSIPDFQSAVPEIRLGDILYLTVFRAGKRLQIPIRILQSAYRPEQ
jgi:S1-C subfamily serine protease